MVRARVRRGRRRRGALVGVAVVSLAWCSSCSSSAGADEPVEEPAVTTATAPVPAPATAEAIGLEAPHSGDLPVGSECPGGTEMLDWDGDGWGDCVAAGAPPTISAP